MIRLLLVEFIHADGRTYADAPAGLRIEGRAMLNALASDAAEAMGVCPTVLLCEAAVEDGCRFSRGVGVTTSDSCRPLIEQLTAIAGRFDAVLPVVPECEQLLPLVARTLKDANANTLLPSQEFVETCSDKLATWQVFRNAGVPMLECTDIGAGVVSAAAMENGVFKDRWGAGCEGIHRERPDDMDLTRAICQRWIDAESLSVGVLGNGDETFVLPIAHQRIQWANGRPKYVGGDVPAIVDSSTTHQVTAITQKVLAFAAEFAGYFGIDFLVDKESGTVFLNEVNPRLCTSYIGYRRLLNSNALELMLGITPMDAVTLRSAAVSFDKSGVLTVDVG